MSGHYRRFIIALSVYQPQTSNDLAAVDRLYSAAKRAERYGKRFLCVALLESVQTAPAELQSAVRTAIVLILK